MNTTKVVGIELAKNVFQVCVWLTDNSVAGTKKSHDKNYWIHSERFLPIHLLRWRPVKVLITGEERYKPWDMKSGLSRRSMSRHSVKIRKMMPMMRWLSVKPPVVPVSTLCRSKLLNSRISALCSARQLRVEQQPHWLIKSGCGSPSKVSLSLRAFSNSGRLCLTFWKRETICPPPSAPFAIRRYAAI